MVAALTGAPGVSAAATAPVSWSQPGFGPENTYYNPAETGLTAATVGHLQRRWSVTTRATPDLCTLNSPPLAANDRLFTTDPTGAAAYAPTTGRRLWHWTFPGLASSPGPGRSRREKFGELVLSGGRLLALTVPCEDGPGKVAHLTALDPATGTVKWRLPLDRYAGALVVDRGVAAVGSRGDAQSTIGYRITDGARLWKVRGYRLTRCVSAAGRLLLSRADDKAALAVSITTGEALWRTREAWSVRAASPTGDRFLISTGTQGLASVDAATGALGWATRHSGPLADDGNRIYVTYNRTVETYDARTGRKLRITGLASHGGQPVRAGGLLYLTVDATNPIAILDPATGSPVAAYPEMRLLAQPPVIVNGWLYTTDGETLRGYAPSGA